MKMKNVFLVGLLTVASLQIQASEAQVEETAVEQAAQQAAPVEKVNPIPAEIRPNSGNMIEWAFDASLTPEEQSDRAALLLEWDYPNYAQAALLQTLIIPVAEVTETVN